MNNLENMIHLLKQTKRVNYIFMRRRIMKEDGTKKTLGWVVKKEGVEKTLENKDFNVLNATKEQLG